MLSVLDSTMRDGAQHNKISYSVDDKLGIADALYSLGIDYIEYGAPAFDDECALFERRTKIPPSALVAFGMTARKGVDPALDKGIRRLIDCRAETIALVGKADSAQVKSVLGVSCEEYLENITKSVAEITKSGKKVIFDAEHFFDGFLRGDGFAAKALKSAEAGGAFIVTLCDTNGGSLPDTVSAGVSAALNSVKISVGIHTHNDSGLAVANTLEAEESGATHIQGTLLGLGERSGNACLSTLIPLFNRLGKLHTENLKMLTPASRAVAEISNIAIPPESVGNVRRLVLSKESGRHLVKAKLSGIIPEADDPDVFAKIFNALKARESEGYSYEAAEASFYLMAARIAGRNVDFFKTIDYSVTDSADASSRAETTIEVAGKRQMAVATGSGPVHALDRAMRKCMIGFFPAMDKVSLVDYKVRVIDPKSATGASVRVSITTTDGKRTWKTIGVSGNVIHASFMALEDSYRFALNDDFNHIFA